MLVLVFLLRACSERSFFFIPATSPPDISPPPSSRLSAYPKPLTNLYKPRAYNPEFTAGITVA